MYIAEVDSVVKSSKDAFNKEYQTYEFVLHNLQNLTATFCRMQALPYCISCLVCILGARELVSSFSSLNYKVAVFWMFLLLKSSEDMRVYLSIGMACYCLSWCKRRRYSDVPFAFAIAGACDNSALVVYVPLLVIILYQHVTDLINRETKDMSGVLALINALFLCVSFLFDFSASTLHKEHTPEVSKYSLFFQTSLKNFAYGPGFFSDSTTRREPVLPTDRYVIDRSLVRIININHKKFMSSSQCEGKNVDYPTHTFEIQKIFTQEDSKDPNRYLGNGDLVRIVNPNTNEVLGPAEADANVKLVDTFFGSHEDERDLWVLECDGELEARRTVFRLRHHKTGLMLGCHNVKDSFIIHASVYSDIRSRDFIIADNTNHAYFKERLDQAKAREQVLTFRRASYSELVVEHLKLTFNAKRNNTSTKLLLFSLSTSAILTALIFLSRYLPFSFCVELTQESSAVTVMFIFTTCFFLNFVLRYDFLFGLCLSVIYNLLISSTLWHLIVVKKKQVSAALMRKEVRRHHNIATHSKRIRY